MGSHLVFRVKVNSLVIPGCGLLVEAKGIYDPMPMGNVLYICSRIIYG